ncbi:hypothetical protein H6P81_010496 [Aristolochia fimbriata]|uniref:CCHC-type domain-containing protein n=1 Tax=Aristolochia fimbriata TaxID=158543 RepID=A0AAV7EQ24_ARIFI|nr:hypothetical protein H6P81_010496 [Aristolochia fimbriata]
MAKEAWKILEVHYEGTESVSAVKLQILMTQFELMRMRDDETILEFEDKIRGIANQSANLGDRIPQDRLVKKVLRSLSSKFKMKRIALEENRSLNDMTLDELIGSLKTFEMNEESSDSVRENKRESVALQTFASNEATQLTQEIDTPTITLTELDAKVSLLAKGLNKFIRKIKKKNYSSGEGKQSGVSFDLANKSKVITCYECGGRGHIQSECPTYLKKKKSFVAAWSDDSSTSEDDECNYVAFTASTQVNNDEDDIGTVENIIKQWDGVLESTKVLREQVGALEREKVVLKQKLDEKEAEARKTESKESLLRKQICVLDEENHVLKQKVNEKEERILKMEEELRKAKEIWVKFDKGKQQLDDILTQEKQRGNKHGLGYRGVSSSLQPSYTQTRHKRIRKFIPTCHYCGV